MSRRSRFAAVGVALILLASPGAVAGIDDTAGATPQGANEPVVDACTTIDSPGHYTLESDLETGQDTCIHVAADDVVLNGAGHSIDNTDLDAFRDLGRLNGQAVLVGGDEPVENVTVRNVTGTTWGTLVAVTNATDVELAGVVTPRREDVPEDARRDTQAISVWRSRDVLVHDSTIQDPTIDAAFTIADSTNVSVRNTTVSHVDYHDQNYGSADGLVVENSSVVSVVDSSVTDAPGGILGGVGVEVTDSEDVRFAHDAMTDGTAARLGSNTTLVDTEVRNASVQVAGANVRVAGNAFTGAGLDAAGSDVTIADTAFADGTTVDVGDTADAESPAVEVVGNDFQNDSGVVVRDGNVAVENNTIRGATRGVAIEAVGATVTDNVLVDDEVGVYVADAGAAVTVAGNQFRDVDIGVGVANGSAQRCVDVSAVAVHQNAFLNSTEYAIRNEDGRVVNATGNYWGAADGPASATEDPLRDPRTGTLADGAGGAVSASPTATGVSNVHFDGWLDRDPTDDETANRTPG